MVSPIDLYLLVLAKADVTCPVKGQPFAASLVVDTARNAVRKGIALAYSLSHIRAAGHK
jgi:hypothetical protein